jgi:hypothetical protein
LNDKLKHFEGIYDAFIAAEKHRHTLFALEGVHSTGETMQAAFLKKVKGKEVEINEKKLAEEL